MAVTMRDIAKAAEVDTSVVSAVLNGSKSIRVSEKKRELVLSLVKQMNYHPNLSARSLITRKSFAVGVLFYSTRDRFYAELMAELQQQLIQRGYVGIYAFWNNDEEAKQAYDTVLKRGVDGIITCHNDSALIPASTPTVIYGMPHRDYDYVIPDYYKAVRKSLEYLTALGHRKIGFLCSDGADLRCVAYRELLSEFGLKFDPDFVFEGAGFHNVAYEITLDMLSRKKRPTAVFAKNDMTAMGAICAAGKLGLSVPEDLSLVSFDNIEESGYFYPSITTNGCEMKFTACRVIDALFERMENPDMPPREIMLEMELFIRQSCALC